jgi:GNAT superfamily N-acetyltransferase
MRWQRQDGYFISTEKDLLSIDVIHGYISRSYWAPGRPREVVQSSIENSTLSFGVYAPDGTQVGFARVVSDLTTMYWLGDVFVLEEHRGKGLGKWLVDCIVHLPQLEKLSGLLATRDAHELYAQYGFKVPDDPRLFMRRKLE